MDGTMLSGITYKRRQPSVTRDERLRMNSRDCEVTHQ
jgi:hypothetical protein